MLRRLTALFLALACAFALALPAHETSDAPGQKNDCCCGPDVASTCGDRDCAPQPGAPSGVRTTAVATTEQQAPAAKATTRISRRAFAAFLSFFSPEKYSATPVRTPFADRVAPAASVALFQAHCSLLI